MSQILQNSSTPQMLTTLTPTQQPPPLTHQAYTLNGDQQKGDEVIMNASMFLPQFKQEPFIDLDEVQNKPDFTQASVSEKIVPKTYITPTTKLIATPNPIDPKRKFTCPYADCTKSYGKSSHLRSHLTWHTGIKPFVCNEPTCGKSFTRSDELNRHVRTHTGEKPFECIQCTKKFSRSDHLTKHLATHGRQAKGNTKRTQRNATAKQVNKSFNSISASTTTETVPEFKSIELMGINCIQPINASTSAAENQNAIKNESNAQYQRSQHAVATNLSFNTHKDIVKHEPLDDAVSLPLLPPTDGPNTYEMPQFIGKSDERPYSCSDCVKRFRRQDDLNRHIRTHTGEKRYACNQCERRFIRSDHLKKHQLIHTKKR